MSTYLELCQDTARECAVAGSGPAAVTNQTGELARIVRWVRDAYKELQASEPNWRWLRSEFTFQTVADDDQYAYADVTDSIASATISRFDRWWTEEVQIYLTSAGIGGRHHIPFMRWERFRRVWLTGNPGSQYPSCFSIDPRDNLRLGGKPAAVYTVTGEYQKSPQILAADDDEPEMPAKYHGIIMARAMQKYAAYHGAPEVDVAAERIIDELTPDLRTNQLPEPRLGPPLA